MHGWARARPSAGIARTRQPDTCAQQSHAQRTGGAPDQEARLWPQSRARRTVSSDTIAVVECRCGGGDHYGRYVRSIRASLHMSSGCSIQSPITREIHIPGAGASRGTSRLTRSTGRLLRTSRGAWWVSSTRSVTSSRSWSWLSQTCCTPWVLAVPVAGSYAVTWSLTCRAPIAYWPIGVATGVSAEKEHIAIAAATGAT